MRDCKRLQGLLSLRLLFVLVLLCLAGSTAWAQAHTAGAAQFNNWAIASNTLGPSWHSKSSRAGIHAAGGDDLPNHSRRRDRLVCRAGEWRNL